jgi:hypothetical protein
MLEEKVLRLKRSESDTKPCTGTWFYCRRFGIDLKHSHIIPIEILPLLRDPIDRHLAWQIISHNEFLLTTDSHRITMPKVYEITTQCYQLIIGTFKE